jgi:hypothetical protein
MRVSLLCEASAQIRGFAFLPLEVRGTGFAEGPSEKFERITAEQVRSRSDRTSQHLQSRKKF